MKRGAGGRRAVFLSNVSRTGLGNGLQRGKNPAIDLE